ncbi:Phosphoacetylglucosamine mutase [Nosema bombycis CQ1]|uniref:phosphoacetylglucosamine mutase n=1 Tax=Nosema bombycis (strain CQ1 / CVCC 102059) TaxID=578461 RepID=R0MGQ9_NOSB1|nr:Phosphoacetylglucosamine mutase [Nosema bombycis CQ1]|eukprot:EOB11938.1 Phosphoacetylglucosamine mutase [Nosema bombycis CQ1]
MISPNNMRKKIEITSKLTKPSKPAYYGTAGYRSKDSDVVNIITRAAFIAFLRSSSFAGKRIGLIITASHNPIEYNGVKFIDHNGNMLDNSWERCSDELVNCEDKDFSNVLNKIFRKNSNFGDVDDGVTGHVVVGRDTRESGIEIIESIKKELQQVDCTVEDYGVVTTPEMHFLIRQCNLENKFVNKSEYITSLVKKYLRLSELTNNNIFTYVDTSNGVVGLKFVEMESLINEKLDYMILNEKDGVLNQNCGADFVKTKMMPPIITSDVLRAKTKGLYVSFDGDADRLIMFNFENDFTIFDGDAQASFLANQFELLINQIDAQLTIGIILSYYSNDAVFNEIKRFKTLRKTTGVKNFVKAARKYDIGIYFEPNGHGSVVFSNTAFKTFESGDTTQHEILRIMSQMFDPSIGDALANFLVFKALIKSADTIKTYQDYPSRLMTVKVKDKNLIQVNKSNEVLIPTNLQELINSEAKKFNGRSFVRPSGTEDLVRIYAESPNASDTDFLAVKVAQHVYDNCEGVGDHPEIDYSK